LEETTNQPIIGANILIQGTTRGAVTDEKGQFKLNIKEYPRTISISYIGYETRVWTIQSETNKEEIIYLSPKANILDVITVTPNTKAESMSEINKYSIAAFEIIKDQIFRLEYHGSFKKYRLSCVNLNGQEQGALKLKKIKRIEGLHKSCTDHLYLLSETYAYLISSQESGLAITSKIRIDTFNLFIKPCKLQYGRSLFYLTERTNGLINKIFRYDVDQHEMKPFKTIKYKELLDNYLWELELMQKAKSIGNGQTNDVNENRRIRNLQSTGDFLENIFYKPRYPNYISKRDTQVILFNHFEKKIESYGDHGLATEVEAPYIKDSDWLKIILSDQATEKIYGLFSLEGKIGVKEIDTQNGSAQLVGIVDATRQNKNNLRIYNGSVYYLREDAPIGGSRGLMRFKL